jgi:uncharacterized protein YdaT
MSTRATYRIFQDGASATYYIHHDGYPEGAAQYFKAAGEWVDARSNQFIDAFLRANDRAEHTESHEVHGDTEYRYDVIADAKLCGAKGWMDACLIAKERTGNWTEKPTWKEFYNGTVGDFIAQYGQE